MFYVFMSKLKSTGKYILLYVDYISDAFGILTRSVFIDELHSGKETDRPICHDAITLLVAHRFVYD